MASGRRAAKCEPGLEKLKGLSALLEGGQSAFPSLRKGKKYTRSPPKQAHRLKEAHAFR